MKMINFCVNLRPLKRAFFLFFGSILLLGCTHINKFLYQQEPIVSNSKIHKIKMSDYVDHLSHLSKSVLENRDIKVLKISKRNNDYLNEVFQRIVSNNELLLPKETQPKFFLIDDRIPYIFSLPNYQFFLSKGLVKKYFKNESLLVSALCFEIVKSGRNLYPAQKVFPLGFIQIPQLLSLVRIDLETKIEVYKWTYFALRRSEYDAMALLNWIQTQNKNTLDFSWQIRDPRGVSREEFLFKNFLVSQGLNQEKLPEINSSKMFYRFQDSYK